MALLNQPYYLINIYNALFDTRMTFKTYGAMIYNKNVSGEHNFNYYFV